MLTASSARSEAPLSWFHTRYTCLTLTASYALPEAPPSRSHNRYTRSIPTAYYGRTEAPPSCFHSRYSCSMLAISHVTLRLRSRCSCEAMRKYVCRVASTGTVQAPIIITVECGVVEGCPACGPQEHGVGYPSDVPPLPYQDGPPPHPRMRNPLCSLNNPSSRT